MGLSRTQAIILYAILLVAGIGVACFPLGNYILSFLLMVTIFICTLTFLFILPYCCKKKASPHAVAPAPQPLKQIDVEQAPHSPSNIDSGISDYPDDQPLVAVKPNPEPKPTNKPSKRLLYIDNLKAFLTVIVILHHVTCSFTGTTCRRWMYKLGYYYNSFMIPGMAFLEINRSYFMCLFFFISGYFTPISYDRKGPILFITDKLKRLGVPYLVYTFILGPLLDLTIKYGFINNGSTYSYYPTSGPCWFIGWLLIFNAMYLVMDPSVPVYITKLPAFWKLMVLSITLGVIQLVLAWFVLIDGSFIGMPVAQGGSLLFDILFFIGGVMAKRNDWLHSIKHYYPTAVGILMALFILLNVTVMIVIYGNDMGGYIPRKDMSTDCNADSDDSVNTTAEVLSVLQWVISGPGTIVMSLGMMQFAEKYWNYRSEWTSFLSQQAYAVYLIHPLVICPVTWMYACILESTTSVEFEFCEDDTASMTHFDHYYEVWIGWLFTSWLSLIIVWPNAWFIRQIPGMNRII